MAGVPMDVIIDILARLPVKPLLRFKCVSKSWRDLISDRRFVKLHLKQSLETDSHTRLMIGSPSFCSIYIESRDSFDKMYDPLGESKSFPSIVGSCNGLLCLKYDDMDHTLVLYNPSTQMYKKVLPPSGESLFTRQASEFGFGYHSACDDFKVVRILQFPGMEGFSYQSFADVYSMNNDSWTCIQSPPCPLFYHHGTSVLVNEVLHWIGIEYPGSDSYYSVIGFRLADQSFTKVPHPQFVSKQRQIYLGVLSGCLSLLVHHEYDTDVWMMKSYGVQSSWIKLYNIPMAGINRSYGNLNLVAYSRCGREVFFWQRNNGLFSYDLEEKSFKQVGIPLLPAPLQLTEAMLYTETLVQPNNGCYVSSRKEMLRLEEPKMEIGSKKRPVSPPPLSGKLLH